MARSGPERFQSSTFSHPAASSLEVPYIPAGVLFQYVPENAPITNMGANRDELRAKVERLNAPGFLIPEFFEPGPKKNGSIVHEVLTLRSGARVGIKQNSGPYGDYDLGISAIPPGFEQTGFVRKPDGTILPHTWTDIPADAQEVVSNASIAAFVTMEERKRPGTKTFMTNVFSRQLQPDGIQSGAWEHLHVFSFPADRISTQQTDAPEHKVASALAGEAWTPQTARRAERGALIVQNERLMNIALRRGIHAFEEQGADVGPVSIGVRRAAPYGIAAVFDQPGHEITLDNATDPENLQRILNYRNAVADIYPKVATGLYAASTRRPERFAAAYGEEYAVSDEFPLTDPLSRMEVIDITPSGHLRVLTAPMIGLGPIEGQHVFWERTSDLQLAALPPADLVPVHFELAQAAMAQVGSHNAIEEVQSYNPLTKQFAARRV